MQASREDRIRVITATIARQELGQRQLASNGRLPHDVARALAERIADAVAAVDDAQRARNAS